MTQQGPVGFDLDLTLIDSRPAILASFGQVARETGTAIDLAAVDRRLGPTEIGCLAVMMTTRSPAARTAASASCAPGRAVVMVSASWT